MSLALYIGYPKAASTFVENFLNTHPEVTIDRNALQPLLKPSIDDIKPETIKLAKGKTTHISINEKVAESIVCFGDRNVWLDNMFVADRWDAVSKHVLIDREQAAMRMKKAFPSAKIVMTIREQVDWLDSAYRYFLAHLPPDQRSFTDFCATPRGIAYLDMAYFNQTIEVYADLFGAKNLLILRFEELASAPTKFGGRLTEFLGIKAKPLPRGRANVGSTSRIASVRRTFPIVDKFPYSVRKFGRQILSSLPAPKGSSLTKDEIQIIRSIYKLSNQKTEKLINSMS